MSAAQRTKKIIATGLAGLALTAGIGVATAGTASAGTPNKHVIIVEDQSLTLKDQTGFSVGHTEKLEKYFSRADHASQTFGANAVVDNHPNGVPGASYTYGDLKIQAWETDAATGHMRFVITNEVHPAGKDTLTAITADLDAGQNGRYHVVNQTGGTLVDGWLTLTNTLVK